MNYIPILIIVIPIIGFPFICAWICLGCNPIEQIDLIFDTSIGHFLEKHKNLRLLKRFHKGAHYLALENCKEYLPSFIDYWYHIPTQSITQQEVFDFNLEVLKYWLLVHGTDFSWNNMGLCICNNHYIFIDLLLQTCKEEPVLLPAELIDVFYENKELFYQELVRSVDIDRYSQPWTILHFSAENGNESAQKLLEWIDKIRAKYKN